MSFATRIAQASKPMPIYVVKFGGDLDADMGEDFASTSNWTAGGSGANISVETTNAKGLAGGIKFDKGAGNVQGGYNNASLAPVDLSTFAYETLWLYLPSVTDIASILFRRGSDAGNFFAWVVDDSNLVDGWNEIHLSRSEVRSGDTYSGESGTVDQAAVDFLYVLIETDAAGDTLTGVIVLPPRQHPYRYSTPNITAPIADTKPWAGTPSVSGNSHDPTTATLSSSSASVEVVDLGSATVLADMARFAFPGRDVTISMGFAGDSETAANYQPIFRGSVVSMEAKGRAWTLTFQDILARMRVAFARSATSASPMAITGNAFDVALTILTSTGNGTNGDYDTLTEAEGAGISADLIDVAGIETMRDEWRSWALGEWSFPRSQSSALEFVFREICLAYSAVPYITPEGLLSFRASEEGVYPATSTSPVFDSANIITRPPEYRPDLERIRNQVRVLYDWNEATGEYDADTGDAYRLQESIDRYGLRELTIESKGIRSASVAEKVAKSHYYRIGDGSPPVSMEVFASQQPRTVGELVEITTALVPDIASGTYTSTGIVAELEQASFNPEAGRVAIRAGVTSYRRGAYRRIAPSGTADYDSQTDTEKARYCSIADGSDELGAASDPAHRIGP